MPSGVTLNFVLEGEAKNAWGAKHTFCQILGANLVFLPIEIHNIGGAKKPGPAMATAPLDSVTPLFRNW